MTGIESAPKELYEAKDADAGQVVLTNPDGTRHELRFVVEPVRSTDVRRVALFSDDEADAGRDG